MKSFFTFVGIVVCAVLCLRACVSCEAATIGDKGIFRSDK